MHSITGNFFSVKRFPFPVIFLVLSNISLNLNTAFSQDCTLVREKITFGSGTNPGPKIPGMLFKFGDEPDCPGDRSYKTVSSINGSCFKVDGGPAWHEVAQDHSGISNGYMANINSPKKGEPVYEMQFNNLCTDSNYTAEMFVMNIKKDLLRGVWPSPIIEIYDCTGINLIAKSELKPVPPTEVPTWKRREVAFNSGNCTSVKIVIKEFGDAAELNGGDYVLDDIALIGSRSVIPPGAEYPPFPIDSSIVDTIIPPPVSPPLENKTYIPNAFSPNGDGINDTWNLSALNLYNTVSVSVFNRYGKPVFRSNGSQNNWDGTSNGRTLPVGVYYYVIDISEEKKKLSGWLMLVQ